MYTDKQKEWLYAMEIMKQHINNAVDEKTKLFNERRLKKLQDEYKSMYGTTELNEGLVEKGG